MELETCFARAPKTEDGEIALVARQEDEEEELEHEEIRPREQREEVGEDRWGRVQERRPSGGIPPGAGHARIKHFKAGSGVAGVRRSRAR